MNWELEYPILQPETKPVSSLTSDTVENSKNFFRNFKGKPFRVHQRETIERILNSDKKIIVVQGPTGSGKSLIAACVIHELNRRNGDKENRRRSGGIYLCSTKTLQDQLEYYFPEFTMLKGRHNYKCGADIEGIAHADECVARFCEPDCPYKVQRNRALESPYRILNYSYYLTATNFTGLFCGIPTLICDEADKLEHILNNFISINISEYQLKQLGIHLPQYKTSSSANAIGEWKDWAARSVKILSPKIEEIKRELEDDKNTGNNNLPLEPEVIRKARKKLEFMEGVKYKLVKFIAHVDSTWIQKREKTSFGEKFSFEPLWITPGLVEDYLLRHVSEVNRKIILMSATFPPVNVLAKTLGLSFQDMDYFEVPSTFDPARRPIYMQPAGNMSYKTFDESVPKLCKKIQDILNKHPKEKGIIHCVSFKLANEIRDRVSDSRLMFHDSDDRDIKLEEFKESDKPNCFVSPSLERGVSLDDDLARFVILAKAPFLSLADKKVSARIYSSSTGQNWYIYDCVQTIIQATGRATRSVEDWATVYILDEEIKKLILKHPSLFPLYFKDSIQLIGD